MSRAVYIGGFGNGLTSAEHVGRALDTDDVFTFSYAMDNPERIARAVRGARLYMHSSGIKAAVNTRPAEFHAVAAPLPSSAISLVLKTGIKSARMLGHSLTSFDAFKAVNQYNASSFAELALHPVGNLRHLRQIADTSAIELAAAAQGTGILTQLYFMDRDDYGFVPNPEQQAFAKAIGVELHMLPGRHDQLPLYPAQTLESMG